MNVTKRAFTLIELLIVVLILAIIAALAVPNFLEFQVRAKVARAKSDMRTLATAIEAYAIDNSDYPVPGDERGDFIADYPMGAPHFIETRVSPMITTPIAYINNRLNEPFAGLRGEDPQFHYTTVDYARDTGGVPGKEDYHRYIQDTMGNVGQIKFFLLSHGPDYDHDAPNYHEGIKMKPVLYDPTNGTRSNGDILYFGFGVGVWN